MLQVLVCSVGNGTTDQEEGVDTNAEAGGLAGLGGGRDGAGCGGLGGRVAGLENEVRIAFDKGEKWKGSLGHWECNLPYLSLQNADLELL